MLKGEGVLTTSNGDELTGKFKDYFGYDESEFEGTLKKADGCLFKGKMKDGLFKGKILFTDS